MSPANGSSSVGLSSNIVMNFNELITLAPNVTMTLTDSNGRSYAFNSYNGNKGLVSGQTVSFDPSFTLQLGMRYTLHIGGGILDMAGNKAAIPDDTTFTIGAATTSGTDGDDFLNDIERVVFSDHAVALDIDGHGGQAYRLYQAAFNRTPDQDGLGFWIAAMDKGMSLQTVAHGFAMSPEFQAMYGSAPTDAQYVSQLYQNVLHRAGDASGTSFWLDALQHGHSRDEVLTFFSESPENQAALIGKISNGITYILHS